MVLLITILFAPRHAAAAPNPPCSRAGALADSYDYNGYHYQVADLVLNGGPSLGIKNPDAGSYLTTLQCNGTYGSTMDPNRADYVTFNRGVFKYVVGNNGSRTVAPIQIDLGITPNPGHGTDPTKTTFCIPDAVTPDTALSPPLAKCGGLSGEHLRSALVDDAGRLVIRDNKNSDHTIWCVGLVANPNGFAAHDCPPDVRDTNTKNGSGFLYTFSQCQIMGWSPCDSSGYAKWYLGAGMYNGVDSTASTKGTTRLTDVMDSETSTGYLKNGFYNHMDSRNTQAGGFAAYNYYTLTYPNNAATCSYNRTNNNIDVTYKNTGTRIWRNSDGYIVRVRYSSDNKVHQAIPFAPADFIQKGDTKTFSGIPVPASGAYTIELDQDEGGVIGPDGTGPPITALTEALTLANQHIQSDGNYERIITTCNPQTSITCRIGTVPTTGEVGIGFNFTITLNNFGASPSTGNATVYLRQPNGASAATYKVVVPSINSPPNNPPWTGPSPALSYTPSQAGDYTFNVTYGGVTFTPCGQITVGNKPYVRVYNGDVFAGTDNSCATTWGTNTTAGLRGFSNGALGGSGSQLGAMAFGDIDGFSSAILETTSPPLPINALDFANIPPFGHLGGNPYDDSYAHCPYDYWGNKPPSASNATTDGFGGRGINH